MSVAVYGYGGYTNSYSHQSNCHYQHAGTSLGSSGSSRPTFGYSPAGSRPTFGQRLAARAPAQYAKYYVAYREIRERFRGRIVYASRQERENRMARARRRGGGGQGNGGQNNSSRRATGKMSRAGYIYNAQCSKKCTSKINFLRKQQRLLHFRLCLFSLDRAPTSCPIHPSHPVHYLYPPSSTPPPPPPPSPHPIISLFQYIKS